MVNRKSKTAPIKTRAKKLTRPSSKRGFNSLDTLDRLNGKKVRRLGKKALRLMKKRAKKKR